MTPLPSAGCLYAVDASGCDPAALADGAVLAALLDDIIAGLALTPVAPAVWHRFPPPGGMTGMVMLAESHLAIHTFPEHGSVFIDLFCCRPRAPWDFAAALAHRLGAARTSVRRLERSHGPALAHAAPGASAS